MNERVMELNRIYNEDCLEGMRLLEDNSVNLIVTSPPYFNAREYSQWNTVDDYMEDMKNIFSEGKRVLKNYSMVVVNVGDIIGTSNGRNSGIKKFPLGAYFIKMLEEIGLVFIDDIIWDKGEVQSKRNFVGENYPHQKYPINCYEHILVFRKFEKDKEKPNCPECNKNISVSNGISNNTYTYECKNPECRKSKSGRGVRYSSRQIQKNKYQIKENLIDEDFAYLFRKDIVRITPVIKINSKKENILGHTAPFPKEIPKFAILFYSGVGDSVLDMFMGSGTTAIECIDAERKYIGFELDETYYEKSLERIKNHTTQTEIFDLI